MKLRDILKTEKDWTKGYFARAEDGEKVEIDDTSATCYCLIGAMDKANLRSFSEAMCESVKKLFPERTQHGHPIVIFNDHPETTFDDVCKVIELAGV